MVDQHSTSSPPSASGANAGAGAGANRGIVDLAEGGDAGPSLPPHVRGIHKYALPGSPSEKQVIRVPETERYRVRAVYDFEAADDSALSFRAGDIIDVLTMLPSGWWDGMLDSARGWFPSNYVEDCDDSDLDDGDEYDDEGYPLSDNYIVIRPDGQAVQRGSGGGDMLGLEGRRQKQQQQWNAWDGDDDANGERTIQGDAGAESTIHASEGIWIPFLNSAGEVSIHQSSRTCRCTC